MGSSLAIPLQSADNREDFVLDIGRYGSINLKKISLQNRARKSVVLMRLDVAGAPHCNPDGEEIPAPHLHVYREGFGDKWAESLPVEKFRDSSDIGALYEDFLVCCNITRPPKIQGDLFA